MPPSRPAPERFWEKVNKTETCWLWMGAQNSYGYGSFADEGRKTIAAHRWAYLHTVGPIPEDRPQLDHLCRVRHCVNPDHLEPVTNRENMMRGETTPAKRIAQTHCIHGHQFTDENTYLDVRGNRQCKACHLRRVECPNCHKTYVRTSLLRHMKESCHE